MRHFMPRLVAVGVAAALLLAACGDDDDSGSTADTDTTATSTTDAPDATTTSAPGDDADAPATVAVGESDLGDILVDAEGMTLYVFDNDTTPGASNCNDECAAAWPPLIVTGTPTYGGGLDASMFSTVTRNDGSMQVAVNGKPLYLWVSDNAPGDTTGQGVGGFYVVSPTGNKISM
jgi:predicted lipoprotein with Yx(FWY)xxD motif